MLFVEFQREFNYGYDNILKYRDVNEEDWYYMYIDIETLNILVKNFGIISTVKIPTRFTNADNESTGKEINLKYCGADIKLNCENNTKFYLPYIEQNY